MNKNNKFMAVILTVIFLFCNLFSSLASPSNEFVEEDYRDKKIKGIYDQIIQKPIAQFSVQRLRNGELIESAISYSGRDIYEPFPTLVCYVGDTLTFKDFSCDLGGANIITWDWQYFGHLGDSYKEYNYNIVNQDSYYLDSPGETTFFLCVKSDVKPKKGNLDPWSENGNHQTVGINKWFPEGMFWYFTAVRVIVHQAVDAQVHVRRWDAQRNTIFNEGTIWPGRLEGEDATVDTTVNACDWDGYEYSGWNVMLPDGTIQYSGTERDVGITLASWLPEKYLNIEYYPYMDTEVKVRYWDATANRVMHAESKYGDKVVKENKTTVSVHIPDWDGYEYSGWNVMLPDSTIQDSGVDRSVNIALNGYFPLKYLNIEYIGIGGGSDNMVTPSPEPGGTTNPEPPDGICDGEITWTETESHRVRTGTDRHGNPTYKDCNHTFMYKAVLTATATVTPETFKSGYGFEVTVDYDITTSLVSNWGSYSSWGNSRQPTTVVKPPTKATVYVPWTMTNRLGTQSQAIEMDQNGAKSFRLPVSPVSEASVRKIYTDVSLAGTKEEPVTHSFDIYISGGGVGSTEFCKKLTKSIIINGDMYQDDFSGAD